VAAGGQLRVEHPAVGVCVDGPGRVLGQVGESLDGQGVEQVLTGQAFLAQT
jgi:hypothetical protein